VVKFKVRSMYELFFCFCCSVFRDGSCKKMASRYVMCFGVLLTLNTNILLLRIN
jgi:hypothetical protein